MPSWRSCSPARPGHVQGLPVTNGDVPLYDGTTWTASSVVDRDGHLTGLSCPTSRFCVTVDDAGEVLTYDRTWSAPIDVDDGGDLVSVSCTSPHFCLAVSEDSPATTYRFDGATWSSVAVPNPSTPQGGSEPNVLSWVSCATSKYCVALDDFGEAFIRNGRDWSGASPLTKTSRSMDPMLCHALLLIFHDRRRQRNRRGSVGWDAWTKDATR